MAKVKENVKTKVIARTKHLRIAPSKLRRVANLVRGKSVGDALVLLQNLTHKPAGMLYKSIYSAKSNALNNHDLDPNSLVVAELRIDEAKTISRFRPRARGRMFSILKRQSHIFVGLEGDQNGK